MCVCVCVGAASLRRSEVEALGSPLSLFLLKRALYKCKKEVEYIVCFNTRVCAGRARACARGHKRPSVVCGQLWEVNNGGVVPLQPSTLITLISLLIGAGELRARARRIQGEAKHL